MRTPQDITIDRALLVYLLHLAEPYGFMSDVKFQQLLFLSELFMFGKNLKGFHFEFMRFAYGAFSKEADNDLLFLRRKERLENFTPTEQAQPVIELVEQVAQSTDVNQQIMDILLETVKVHGPRDNSEIIKAVEAIELSPADRPDQKLAIRDISFHSILLVPSRIEVVGEWTVPPQQLKQLNAALGA
ncbi:MAG: hypothetical protein D6690_14130 [Nitrospirae bacterium]|nr:MAG: hypothetical protein D6690_14130 [Nitrospirota bacterium]